MTPSDKSDVIALISHCRRLVREAKRYVEPGPIRETFYELDAHFGCVLKNLESIDQGEPSCPIS